MNYSQGKRGFNRFAVCQCQCECECEGVAPQAISWRETASRCVCAAILILEIKMNTYQFGVEI